MTSITKGCAIQLLGKNIQDEPLIGSPDITFFKTDYKRYSNFSKEEIAVNTMGVFDFGKEITFTIKRKADLAGPIFLMLDLPEIRATAADGSAAKCAWIQYLGHYLIEEARVEINGQTIDKHPGEWLHIWWLLTKKRKNQRGYLKMIGHDCPLYSFDTNPKPKTRLFIPLQFWFCREENMYLPLVSLLHADLIVRVKFREFDQVAYLEDGATFAPTTPRLRGKPLQYYVYLEQKERLLIAKSRHELLMDHIINNGMFYLRPDMIDDENCARIEINIQNNSKELIWVLQREIFIDGSQPNGERQYHNYTIRFQDTPQRTTNQNESGVVDVDVKELNAKRNGETLYRPSSSQSLASIRKERDDFTYLDNPIQGAEFIMFGKEREEMKEQNYYNYVVPWDYNSGQVTTGIHCYSFAFYPEQGQPSGSVNLSRVNEFAIILKLKQEVVDAINSGEVFRFTIYSINHNLLSFTSGQAGLTFFGNSTTGLAHVSR